MKNERPHAKILEELKKGFDGQESVEFFVLEKTQSKFEDKRFNLFRIDVSDMDTLGVIKSQFVIPTLTKIISLPKIPEIYEDGMGQTRSVPFNDIPYIRAVLRNVGQYSKILDLDQKKLKKLLKKIHAYLVQVELSDGGKLFLFKKYKPSWYVTKKKGHLFVLSDGGFRVVDEELMHLGDLFDYVYLLPKDKPELSIALNKNEFSSIFEFHEAMEKRKKTIIETMKDNVQFSEEVLGLLEGGRYRNKFVRCFRDDRYSPDLFKDYLQVAKERGKAIRYKIESDIIRVEDENALNDFLGVLGGYILEEPVNPSDWYTVPYKEKFGD